MFKINCEKGCQTPGIKLKNGLKERYNVKVLEGDLDYATSI